MYPGAHRETARILLHRTKEIGLFEFFLLKTEFDPFVGLPPRWIAPGGGIDEGETVADAAVRELFEETGLAVKVADLGEIIWRAEGSWLWGDQINRHSFVDHFYALKVETFELNKAGWTADEHRDVLEHRWWSVAELIASKQQVGPPGLVEFITNHRFG